MKMMKLNMIDIPTMAQQLAAIEPWNTLGYRKKSLENYLNNNGSVIHCYKIIHSNKIAGVICFKYPWWKGIYIELFAIFPQFQNKGLGKKAIYWVQEITEQEGLDNMWLLVSDFNQAAYKFYVTQGFVEIGKIDGLLKKEYAEILLRKRMCF